MHRFQLTLGEMMLAVATAAAWSVVFRILFDFYSTYHP
jgi:hypothetical protein